LNNTDWGIPAAGAVLTVLLLGADSLSEGYRRLQHFFTGGLLFIVSYFILLRVITGFWPDPVALFYFAKFFIKNGTISFAMQGWGLHIIVLGTFALVSAVGIIGYSALGKSLYGHRTPYFAGLVYVGIFSLGASLYFINRALLPVLEALFLPWSLCIALMTYGAIRFLQQGRNISAIYPSIIFLTLPVFILFGVTSLSILNGPRLPEEWGRITSPYPGASTPIWLSSIEPRSKLIENKIEMLGERSSIGLISNNSNAIASSLGIKSLSGFWSPMPFTPLYDQSVTDRICWAIQRSHIKSLIVEPLDVHPESLAMFENCLGQGGNLILMRDMAEYQFIPSNESLTKVLDGFPPTLPMVEIQVQLRESKNLDSVNVVAPNGLGNWTTHPIKQTWGIGIIDRDNGVSKIKNDGQRNDKMNLAHGHKLTLWFPDNGSLTSRPELQVELVFDGGARINTVARFKNGVGK
jgi:hypothetical protein